MIRFPIRHGDVLFVEADCVFESSFGELIYDLYYQPKPFFVRNVWRFRGWLGRLLKWENHPRNGIFPNQWRDPDQPFSVGQKVGFMRLVAVDGARDQLLLHIENHTVEAFFVVKRRERRLSMATIVRPKGRFGHVYWRIIQPFHKWVMRAWLANCGQTRRRRLATAAAPRELHEHA
jgi:hypothetical protein